MDSNPELPQFEIVIRWQSSDVAVIAFFGGEADIFDVVVGVETPDDKQALADILYEGFIALQNAAGWLTLDRINQGDGYPF